MSIGLRANGPLGFQQNAGTGAATYDTDSNAALLEASLGSGSTGLVAHAGGGQALATPLPSAFNRVGTTATAGDSVLLPVSKVAPPIYVANRGAASLNVFPATGENINNAGANAAFAVAAGKTAIFVCSVVGQWDAVLSA